MTTSPDDSYQDLGEFHDLFMTAPWDRLRPALRTAFGSLDPGATILDLGAGTGLGTRTLAAVTRARIVAIEPSRTMRAVLTARVADDADLAHRVTVRAGLLPDALDDVRWPAAGFVCAHMLGHLSADTRAATFDRLRTLLAPGAVGLVTVEPDGTEAATGTLTQERQIGDLRYVARYLPLPDGNRYVSEYEVRDGELVLRQERFAGTWEPLTLDQLRQELAGTGLSARPHGDGAALVSLEPHP
ncbi:SAM-dependent methyltransferase [Promicromonospora panici]|uniref:SAM-dependent methyltransferase n=1 Tax=Promicromonospora panici TaxID=2219658 RepID=UPI00101BCD0D|nr:class I SAM-dependent methyltransferase [Promicromonospora panici]